MSTNSALILKKAVSSTQAPAALGPYSQAIAAGGFLFCSGQLGLDPKTGELVAGVKDQTRQALDNINAVLTAGGCTWDSVVKVTIYLKSMNDFSVVNEVYAQVFGSTPPARSTVEVARLPKDGLVEIEVLALKG